MEKIFITMSGGSITAVHTSKEPAEVFIIDYDTEGCYDDDETVSIPDEKGEPQRAFLTLDTATVDNLRIGEYNTLWSQFVIDEVNRRDNRRNETGWEEDDEEETTVEFFDEPGGGVLAYFPDAAEGELNCYSHIGQHSRCEWDYIRGLIPAHPKDWEPLKQELESIGYKLKIQ